MERLRKALKTKGIDAVVSEIIQSVIKESSPEAGYYMSWRLYLLRVVCSTLARKKDSANFLASVDDFQEAISGDTELQKIACDFRHCSCDVRVADLCWLRERLHSSGYYSGEPYGEKDSNLAS